LAGPFATYRVLVRNKCTVRGQRITIRGCGGRKGGRPAKLSAKEIKTIRALLKTADIPVAEIAARFGIARSTLYRVVSSPAA
jgi:DNA invertase Pin-like site-specific DNA recombinase